ncbi:Uncharacterised protein [Mycobacterium tuberculosis]|nr:Uncharacterised protein [Mycobacterium tuberculosis]
MSKNELELALLKLWEEAGIREIYKYKNRIKVYKREGLVRYELFCDITCGTMFTDVEDTANGEDLYAEECKVEVKSLIVNRDNTKSKQLVSTTKLEEKKGCPRCGATTIHYCSGRGRN